MPVVVSAVLDRATVQELLAELLPVTIDLGDEQHRDRFIEILPPQLLEFVPERGLRVQTGARLHWTVAGVGVPFTVQSVRLLLTPVVDAARERVNLVITLEDTDLKNVPKAIDRSVVTQLNARLSARPDAIGWDFGRTLAISIALPPKMAPLDRFMLSAGEMQVAIDAESLRIGLTLPMHLIRR